MRIIGEVFNFSELDLGNNDYDIIAQATNLNTGDRAITNQSLQIRIAHI